MKIFITPNGITIPPHLSTTWKNVSSLKSSDGNLIFVLQSGETITIPEINESEINDIFQAHASSMNAPKESHNTLVQPDKNISGALNALLQGDPIGAPFRVGFGMFDSLGSVMQHNPGQAKAPDLPKEILEKIASIAKIMTPEADINIPKAEPHCNCIHCQIARILQQNALGDKEPIDTSFSENLVKDEELTFQQWEISIKGSNLYNVINRLDKNESYQVFLGDPIGCTCGVEGCEHIVAVLKS